MTERPPLYEHPLAAAAWWGGSWGLTGFLGGPLFMYAATHKKGSNFSPSDLFEKPINEWPEGADMFLVGAGFLIAVTLLTIAVGVSQHRFNQKHCK